IYHGTADSLIPFEHGKALARAAPQALFLPDEGVDHNELPADWRGFCEQVMDFLDEAGVALVEG
ncbi:MAG: alpha/beta hydrolase, partial [Myxococcota bacterium]